MAQVVPTITISIGTGPADASTSTRATDWPHPYVAWSLPPTMVQQRFSVRIQNVDGTTAFTTSGARESMDRFFQFPDGVALNDNFSGLCTVEVAISETTSGAFEWISDVFYLVYDRNLETFINAPQVRVGWQAGNNPDSLPSDGIRLYHLQIATDPLFTDVVYANESIPDDNSPIVDFLVPIGNFVPEANTFYFYRVRQTDGVDWSDWSKVNAFRNGSNIPPTLVINSVTQLHNDTGDIVIIFTVADPDSDRVSVDFTYTRPGSSDRHPLSLVTPAVLFAPGEHRVTWRSNRDEPSRAVGGVLLYGRPSDEADYGPEIWTGPLTIDNTNVPLAGGGIGATNYTYNVEGLLATRSTVDQESNAPVASPYIAVLSQIQFHQAEQKPVVGPPILQKQAAMLARLETGSGTTPSSGWADADHVWPAIVSACWDRLVTAVSPWPAVSYPSGGGPLNPHTASTAFIFISPVAYAMYADAWPRPIVSRQLTRQRFLRGFTDMEGVDRDYPDRYDWDARPSWHIGREVWGRNDAWVQIATPGTADHPACETCEGRHWIASGTAGNYTRTVCPNMNCVDGFDTSVPPDFSDDGRALLKGFIRPLWYRLSSILMERAYDHEERTGLPVSAPEISRIEWTQLVVGRHFSDLEPHVGRPALWPMSTERGTTTVVHQLEDSTDVPGHITKISNNSDLDTIIVPTTGIAHSASDQGASVVPVEGNHGPLKDVYFWGVDPDASFYQQSRPRPTQVDNIRVAGEITRVWNAVPLGFRFLQGAWDAYNTIHYRATGSETGNYHIQVAKVTDTTVGSWSDVVGDNSIFVPAAGLYLIPALTFYMYWNTGNRSLFPVGTRYRLRLRQYDTRSRTFSEWTYSPVFQLLEGVANPVSVISSEYEPWSKRVEVTLRIDDTELDAYNLTKFWYSDNDGDTWHEISPGDIAGSTIGLSSDPASSQNIHTIYWLTTGYNFEPGNVYRIRIQSRPTSLDEKITLPVFRWYAPANPVLDPAESDIVSFLGRRDSFSFDVDANAWVPLETPIVTPGQLELLAMERERIRNHPSASTGWYSFHDGGGAVTDQPGLTEWLADQYAGTDSHGIALNRVAISIDRINKVDLPRAYQQAFAGEAYCRKQLIAQGYYAESHFNINDEDEVDETVTVHPIFNNSDSTDDITDVKRYWRFRVQSRPEGPTDIFNEEGFLAPVDITPLEQVFSKVEMDRLDTFDSQPHARPLRTFVFNHLGQRLSVSQYDPGSLIAETNPPVDAARADADVIWADTHQSGDAIGQAQPTADNGTVTLGGQLKVKPSLLPGEVDTDQLLEGQTEWDGDYSWRVCSYNAIEGPLLARPRPLITQMSERSGLDYWAITYVSQAHERLSRASVAHTTDQWGTITVTGYQISTATATPAWTDVTALDYVSDRRIPLDSEQTQVNQFPWIPRGTDRPRPCGFYDDELMQYLLFTAKKGYSNNWRIISARAMDMPEVCEYEAYWDDRSESALYSPWVVKIGSSYAMYVTAQSGGLPFIMRSTSADADEWINPTAITGVTVGAYPCVVFQSGTYHLWYEKANAGKVCIFYATSTNGYQFTPANAGGPVYVGSDDVGSPSVIYLNGSWVMYLHDTANDCIVSVVSADGVAWSDYQVEMTSDTVDIDGTPTLVVPIHPCVHLDRYRGNLEIFMLFNYQMPSGECRVYRTRLEDRVWQNGVPAKIVGPPAHLIDVPVDRDGVTRNLTVGMSANGVAPGASLKLRLIFDTFSPETVEFHRQSEWVTTSNAAAYSSYVEPDPWYFDHNLVNIAYLELP